MKSNFLSSCIFVFLSLVARTASSNSFFRGNDRRVTQYEDRAIVPVPDIEDVSKFDEVNDENREEEGRELAGGYYGYGYGYYPSYYYGYAQPALADIPTTAIEAGMFETLVAALTAADLVGALSAPNGPFTVFAPTDDAFAALPDGLVECLLNDIPTLTEILLYHVAEGTVLSSQLMNGMTIPTLQGSMAFVTITQRGSVFIDQSQVIMPDVMASNGVIHAIDSVLVPPGVDVAAYLDSCYAYSPGHYYHGNYYGGYHGYQKPYKHKYYYANSF